jgi:predicted MFS family arabinose efflux permease
MGMGGASLLVTCKANSGFALLSNLYPGEIEVKIGIMETTGSIGLILGPALGGFIYNALGYSAVFWVYSACSITIAGIAFKLLPNDKEDTEETSARRMSVWELLSTKVTPHQTVFLALVVVIFGMAGPTYIEPVLAPHLLSLGVSKNLLGLAFAMPTVGYAIAVKAQTMLPPKFNRGIVLIIGLFVEGLAFMFLGPSSLLIVCFGLVLLGLGGAWAYLPSLPLMTSTTIEQNKDIDKQALSDTLSTMMGTCHYIGEAFGPASAGVLTQHFGFASGAIYFGLAVLLYCLFYAVISKQLTNIATCKWDTEADPRHIELEEANQEQREERKESEEQPIDSFEI